ncbi:PREDICTED: uncharacterized protein LOC104817090 [Tarenaya hassleriana]|uniref:uncharacterized protein LOC104817090 n=1 Tax=Tarenaya hassleriana TaxID=28532 RepID=UPI00053C54D9|nr:PREDICTED: uncharacterized protein LOC104817090 [Tarenaya hassleriana]
MDIGENSEKRTDKYSFLKSVHAAADNAQAKTSEPAKDGSENDLTIEQGQVKKSAAEIQLEDATGSDLHANRDNHSDSRDHSDRYGDGGADPVNTTTGDEVKATEAASDERTLTEALDDNLSGTEEEMVTETQSRATEVPVPVSSDNSDSPLIVLQQKAKGRLIRKRKATSTHDKEPSGVPGRTQNPRVIKRKKGGCSESTAQFSKSGDSALKPLSEKFLSAETKKRFEKFKGVEVLAERNVNVMDFRKNHVWDLFAERQLTGTLTYACSFSKGLVREFYANLTPSTDIPGDFMHYKAFVRGRFIEFSPTIINKLLGTPDTATQGLEDFPEGTTLEDMEVALTGEYVAERSGKLPIARLKFESRVMHLIGKTNWLPTRRTDVLQDELALLIFKLLRNEEVNLGRIIYSHILSRAADMRVRYLLPHPCLIQNIIVRQSPEILADSEITEVIQRPLVIESRVQQAKMSRAQLCSKTFTLLLKHDKQLIQVEKLQRKVTKAVTQIRARQHALWTEFQRGESEAAPSSSATGKGKEKMVEDLMSESGDDEDAETPEDLSE